MNNLVANTFIISGDKPAGVFVHYDKAGGIRATNFLVRVIYTIAGIEIAQVAVIKN